MSSGSDTTEFLTTKEVAELLRIKERKLYDLVSAQEIPFVKATGKLLFPKAELLHWIRTGELMSTPKNNARLNVLAGSHDPLLEWAIRESGCGLAMQFDGSLSGLDVFENKGAVATACTYLVSTPPPTRTSGIHLPYRLDSRRAMWCWCIGPSGSRV